MNNIRPFRFWCQKVLPLVYDDSLSYYELLCKVVAKLNEVISNENELNEAFQQLKDWIENWVDTQDFQKMVDDKLDEMVEDGTFNKLINQEIFGDLNEKVNNNTTNINNLTSKVNQNTEGLSNLTSKVNKNTAEIAKLKQRKPINGLGKRYILIADSYGEYGVLDGFINAVNGTAVEQKWVGGAGFTKTGDKSFLTILNSLANHSDIDYVVVFGLYNDSFAVNSIGDNVLAFKNACATKYPGAEIVIVNEGWTKDTSLQGQFQYLLNTLQSFRVSSVTVINTWEYLRSNYSRIADDKIHPANESVGTQLGALAGRILLGGDVDWVFPITQITGTFVNGWQEYGNWTTPYQEMNQGAVIFYFVSNQNHVGIDKGTNIKCDGNNYIEVYRLPNNAGCVIGSGDMITAIPCIIGTTDGVYYHGSCTLEINNSMLRIRPILLNETGNDFRTINLNSIQWSPCAIRGNIYHI